MKIKSNLIVATLAIFLLFPSCKKDKSTPSAPTKSNGSFTFKGETYTVNNGTMFSNGANKYHGYKIGLYFSSDSLTHDKSDDIFHGKGNQISIGIVSPSYDDIPSGTYTFEDFTKPMDINDIGGAWVFLNYNFWPINKGDYYGKVDGDKGTVTITNDNHANYTVKYNCTINGEKLEGSFTGDILRY